MSSQKQESPAYVGFTITGKSLIQQLLLEVHIAAQKPDQAPHDEHELTSCKATIHMSEPKSCFSARLVRQLDLKLSQSLDLYLPNRIRVQGMAIQVCDMPASYDVIIGMDVLNTGDVSLSAANGVTTFSYRTPPQGDLDFVKLQRTAQRKSGQLSHNKQATVLTGRDSPCPCGSGKKHGNCCAKLH